MTWRGAAIALAILLAIALVPTVRHLREAPPPLDPAVRLTLDPPAGAEFGSGGDATFDLAIAPSGRELVFAATTDGEAQLWRRALDSLRAEPIAGTTAATMPAYAADGSSVWYFADGKLHTINLSNGEHREHADAATPAGVAIRSDGAVLFAAMPGPITQIAGGPRTNVTSLRGGDRTHAFPMWAGRGDAFTYLATLHDGRRVIRLHEADGDVDLTRADSHGVVSAGHLLFVRDGTLRAEPLDLDTGRLGPGTKTLAVDVGVSPQGRGAFAVAEDLLASGPPLRRARVLQWFSDTGHPLDVITEPGDYWQVRLSPDERTVAVTMVDPLLRTLDVFRMPATGGAPTRVSLAVAADTDPVWSPDGRQIAFRSMQDGQPQIHTAEGLLFQSPLDEVPTDWTARFLLFHARSPESGYDVWALSPKAHEPRPIARSGFNEIDARVSPDGRWIAYTSDEGGQFDVYVTGLSGVGPRTRVSTAGGTEPYWMADGRVLAFRRGNDILRVELEDSPAGRRALIPTRVLSVPGMRGYAMATESSRLLAIVPAQVFQPDQIHMLIGWKALLP